MSAAITAPTGHGITPSGPRPDETRRVEEVGGIEITALDLSQPLTA